MTTKIEPQEVRFSQWQKKLLDPSRRNPLLHLKPAKGLRLIYPSFEELPLLLSTGKNLKSIVAPFSDEPQNWSSGIKNQKWDKKTQEEQEALLEQTLTTEETTATKKPVRVGEFPNNEELEIIKEAVTHQEVSLVWDQLPELLQSKFSDLAREAKSTFDEGGVHTLYFSIGLLAWKEQKQSPYGYAPIFLFPVQLNRTNIRSPFSVKGIDESITLNPTLKLKLERDFGVSLQEVEEHLEDVQSWPKAWEIFRKKMEPFLEDKEWKIINESRLGLFTFSKQHLWNDLQQRQNLLLEHPVVKKIIDPKTIELNNGSIPSTWETLDKEWKPEDVLLPLPADASQTKAITRVLQDINLVIEGPPGTGKSQTITNLIAALLSTNKRVLFVSEKMTALNVVASRLENIGLDPFCLFLHNSKTTRLQVIQQFQSALGEIPPPISKDWRDLAEKLHNLRIQLNESIDLMHKKLPLGLSPYEILGEIAQVKGKPLPFHWGDLRTSNKQNLDEILELVDKYIQHYEKLTPSAKRLKGVSPWPGDDGKSFYHSLRTLQELKLQIHQWLHSLDNDWEKWVLNDFLKLREALKHSEKRPSMDGSWSKLLDQEDYRNKLSSYLSSNKKLIKLWEPILRHWKPSVASELKQLALEWREIRKQSTIKQWISKRSFLKKCKPHETSGDTPESLLDYLNLNFEAIEEANKHQYKSKKNLSNDYPQGIPENPQQAQIALEWVAKWQNLVSDIPEKIRISFPSFALASHLDTHKLIDLLNTLENCFNDIHSSPFPFFKNSLYDTPLNIIFNQIEPSLSTQNQVMTWKIYLETENKLSSYGLEMLPAVIEQKHLNTNEARKLIKHHWLSEYYRQFQLQNQSLNEFIGANRENKIQELHRLEIEYTKTTPAQVKEKILHLRNLESPEHRVHILELRRELTKKTKHKSLRQLLETMPTTLLQLKPCWLMSPMSIAQGMPSNMPLFDVVIFDEASQIPTAEAVGAISRAKQVVVVGDPKQMPPSRWFDIDDEDDLNETAKDLESILDEALVSFERVSLNWHYRSKHESLIAFSNQKYYSGELITFPTPETEENSIQFTKVDGVYARGGSRTNKKEAVEVVEAIKYYLKTNHGKTIGIITFNQQQQKLVQRLWEQAQQQDAELEILAGKLQEEIFIKNLDNVQGDERDIIIFSSTFGKDSAGVLRQNFGPLNQFGGERRLNVAVSRAREKMHIFTSFDPEELDVSTAKHQGIRDFKDYLIYAKGGEKTLHSFNTQSLGLADSPFELQVKKMLEERGWKTRQQIGCSGYRIDLAVIHPEKPGLYLAGIECDGATYHSFKTARDRDYMRQKILERLGWNILRVWSTDFFEDPEYTIEQLDQKLRSLV